MDGAETIKTNVNENLDNRLNENKHRSMKNKCQFIAAAMIASGLAYVPLPCKPDPAMLGVQVVVAGGDVTFQKLQVYELKSIWTGK
jgi:hypothetical protein